MNKVTRLRASSLLLLLAGCGQGTLTEEEVIRARDRAADHGERGKDDWAKAIEVLRPLVEREDAPAEDLLRMACAELAVSDVVAAQRTLARAEALAPQDPVLLWCRYHLAMLEPDDEVALGLLRRIRALRPDEFTVELALAQVLENLGGDGPRAEALKLYEALARRKPEETGAWRITIVYQLAQILIRTDRSMEAEPLLAEHQRLTDRDVKAPDDAYHWPGTLGAVAPHTPGGLERPAPAPFAQRYSIETLGTSVVDGLRIVTLEAKPLEELTEWRPEELYRSEFHPTVVAFGRGGLELVQGPGSPRRLLEVPVLDVAPFDRRNHGADKPSRDAAPKAGDRELDLLVLVAHERGAALHLLENVGGAWSFVAEPLALIGETLGTDALLPSDYDHEGDVDLLVATRTGLKVLRNDGLEGEQGKFTDATEDSGIPAGVWFATSEDPDHDNDVDYLLRAPEGGAIGLASNERGGVFSDARGELPEGLTARWLVPADFDGDGRTDLAAFGEGLALYTQHGGGGWRNEPRRFPLAEPPTGAPCALDVDLDGACDLVWPVATHPAAGLLAPGFENGALPIQLGEAFDTPRPASAALAFADLDADFDLDFVRRDEQGLTCYTAQGSGHGLALAVLGYKDNSRGVGTILELRSGPLYRRLYLRGEPELVGFGARAVDMARLTWPNGVRHGDWSLGAGRQLAIAQWPGQPGSCPFLYTWNGTTYEFITDVLGITPLGLSMAPGMLVPPDHDEYVLVKGEQFVPKDGFFELHLTEELREVTYLDRIRLDVIDHPADVEIFPNERFSFPPFPEAHTHTVREAHAARSARDQDGVDWTAQLAADDRSFAIPFEKTIGQFRGLATPWTLELAFDPERVRSAEELRLFLNGWFYWTDASVNVAAARSPSVEFVPPILSVPDGQGGWTEIGPIGFPAGKLKTMVVDVGATLDRAAPRIRLSSTLRLYWDSIRLATDGDDAPLVTTQLEPSSARLWQRGFSRSTMALGEHDCEWFDWDELEPEPRWNQHPGMYTKLGETQPLVSAIDDCFVIMGAGDALTVRFDARGLPALPAGWRRDYLVFLDGWAKDRDPNTLEALYVEPLPFHGMSGYPYGAEERYPDDEFHRAYRRDWNTRPATRWIEPLAPPSAGRSKTTSEIPSNSATPAATTESVMRSPSTNTPAAPATSG